MPETFGQYVQVVLEKLVTNHQWDDPYGSLAPQSDPDGKILNALLNGWQQKMATAILAMLIDKAVETPT